MTDNTGASPLLGRTALITGSSSGIGAGVAVAFARAGAACVVINYPSPDQAEGAQAVADQVRAAGAQALAVQADVSSEADVDRLVARALEAAGRIDILVNNAGIGHGEPVEDLPVATWDRVIGIHLRGTFLMTHAVLPGMYASGYGRIINTASQLAYKGAPGLSAYTAAKGGIKLLSRSMAAEWAQFDIQANAIGPGYILTDMNQALVDNPQFDAWVKASNPAQRWGRPDELVGAAVFLASKASGYVNGQIIYVDGGWLAVL